MTYTARTAKMSWANAQFARGSIGVDLRYDLHSKMHKKLISSNPVYKQLFRDSNIAFGMAALSFAVAALMRIYLFDSVMHGVLFLKLLYDVVFVAYLIVLGAFIYIMARNALWNSDTLRMTLEANRETEVVL